MLEFCLTIPYGLILALGGVYGAATAGSVSSLLLGGGAGGALTAIGWASYEDYKENKEKKRFRSPTYAYTVISLLLSALVTFVMAERYMESEKLMPAGIVAGLGAFMCLFYLYNLTLSSNVGSTATRAYEVKND